MQLLYSSFGDCLLKEKVQKKNFSIGGELYLSKVINLRAGYDNQIRNYASADDNKGLSGLSGGIGIKFEEVNFDYGYAEYGASVGLHRFSLALEL